MKKNYTLTFYRKMANTNPEIMKKYKSAIINRMTYDQLIDVYHKLNLKFEEDIIRLVNFTKKKVQYYEFGIKPNHLIYSLIFNYKQVLSFSLFPKTM